MRSQKLTSRSMLGYCERNETLAKREIAGLDLQKFAIQLRGLTCDKSRLSG